MPATQQPFEPALVDVNELWFDDQNPRLRAYDSDRLPQSDIFATLWEEFAVDEIATSIAANGFFTHEPLLVVEEGGRRVVLEGNRRLAALKALLGLEALPAGSQVATLDAEDLDAIRRVPVITTTREHVWNYIGFKHVNGPQAWQSVSKAIYIGWVHNKLDIPLDQIAERIGDRHATVQRLYRSLMVIEQAERRGVFDRNDRWKTHFSFSHLYTGLDYNGIQAHINVAPASEPTMEPVPNDKIDELGELCVWLYGSKSRNAQPVVVSQNPDLRILDETIQTENGLAALRQNLPLRVSRDIGRGDDRILRESLVSARQSLQTARGKVITGFHNEDDLLRLAVDILDLADAIHDDMNSARKRRRRRGDDD